MVKAARATTTTTTSHGDGSSKFHMRVSTTRSGMGYVLPYAMKDGGHSSSSMSTENGVVGVVVGGSARARGEDAEIFSFNSIPEIEQQEPARMSSADELFHNGKIRPLGPFAHLHGSHHQPTVQPTVYGLSGFPKRASTQHSSGAHSAPASPLNSTLSHEPSQASAPYRLPTLHGFFIADSNMQANSPKPAKIPFYRRWQSFSPIRKVFLHMDDTPKVKASLHTTNKHNDLSPIRKVFHMDDTPKVSPHTTNDRSPKVLHGSGFSLKDLFMPKEEKHGTPLENKLPKEQVRHMREEIQSNDTNLKVNKPRSGNMLQPLEIPHMKLKRSQGGRSHGASTHKEKVASPTSLDTLNTRASSSPFYSSTHQKVDSNMRKKTFLPYRPVFFTCLGFNMQHHYNNNHCKQFVH